MTLREHKAERSTCYIQYDASTVELVFARVDTEYMAHCYNEPYSSQFATRLLNPIVIRLITLLTLPLTITTHRWDFL